MDGDIGFTTPSTISGQYHNLPMQILALQNGLGNNTENEVQAFQPQDTIAQLDILDGIDLTDLLSSPGFDSTCTFPSDAMETDQAQQMDTGHPHDSHVDGVACPVTSTQTLHAMAGPGPGPMMVSHVPAGPSGTPGNPPLQEAAMRGLEMHSSGGGMFDDLEPTFRIDSTDAKKIFEGDPRLGEESLKSVEMKSCGGDEESNTRDRAAISNNHAYLTGVGGSHGRESVRDGTHPNSHASAHSGINLTAPSSTRTSSSKSYMSNYTLPENHIFKVRVSFLNKTVLDERVVDPSGCLLCYRRGLEQGATSGDLNTLAITTSVRTENGEVGEFKWVHDKQKRYTEMLLQNFQKGLELRSRNGNLYATRRANTKLFWANTQEPAGQARELKRDIETEIFNQQEFRKRLADAYASRNQSIVDLPAVWISFAQKWDRTSCALNTKLVWARIEPTMCRDMVKGVNPSVRESSMLESLDSNNFCFSHE